MLMRMWHVPAIIAAGILAVKSAAAQERDAVLRFAPPQSHAVIVIPNLKAFSDQITQCLEGMDRSNLLMGARPIDQFKAVAGFNVGLNDTGAMAIAFLSAEVQAFAPVFIIPVTDAAAFMRANLTLADDGAYALGDGTIVHARSLGSHVALSANAKAIQSLGEDATHEPLQVIVGESGAAIAAQGDMFVLLRKELLASAFEYADGVATEHGISLPRLPKMLANDVEALIVSLDFDPLGLIARSFAKVKPDSRAARILGEGQPAPRLPLLDDLPAKPFYAAGSWRLSALGDQTAMAELLKQANLPLVPALLTIIDSAEFAIYPSAAGVGGGFLNDSVLVLKTSQPPLVVDAIKHQLLALQQQDRIRREVKWIDEQPINGSLNAAAYEMNTLDVPAELMHQQMAEQLLFGRAGLRGFVKQREDAVLVTFSQRPATLSAALAAVEQPDQDRLAAQPTLRSLRRWLPRNAVIEAYIDLGQVSTFVQAMAKASPLASRLTLPAIDPSLPPIAFGAGPARGGAEHALIVPAGVLATALDQAMRHFPGRDEPAEEDE
jgi:hypothetical protein